MSNLELTVTLRQVTCHVCGIEFAISSSLFEQWVKVGHRISCPNGHRGILDRVKDERDDKPTPQEIERRRELVKTIHDAEQAEARAAEGKTARPDAPAAADPWPNHCPHCDRTFRHPGHMRRHMRHAHAGKGAA